jgi:hypothetical protein
VNGPVVLIGGPRDGEEFETEVQDPPPQIYVPLASLNAAMQDPGLTPTSVLREGIYRLPYVDGGYSRDDSGRLRYVWQGEA